MLIVFKTVYFPATGRFQSRIHILHCHLLKDKGVQLRGGACSQRGADRRPKNILMIEPDVKQGVGYGAVPPARFLTLPSKITK